VTFARPPLISHHAQALPSARIRRAEGSVCVSEEEVGEGEAWVEGEE
jgi:hypothetical protein